MKYKKRTSLERKMKAVKSLTEKPNKFLKSSVEQKGVGRPDIQKRGSKKQYDIYILKDLSKDI